MIGRLKSPFYGCKSKPDFVLLHDPNQWILIILSKENLYAVKAILTFSNLLRWEELYMYVWCSVNPKLLRSMVGQWYKSFPLFQYISHVPCIHHIMLFNYMVKTRSFNLKMLIKEIYIIQKYCVYFYNELKQNINIIQLSIYFTFKANV